MTRVILIAGIVLLTSISTAKAEDQAACLGAKEHFVTVATDLFGSGSIPAKAEITQLNEELVQVKALVAQGECSDAQAQQMQGILNDIGVQN